MADFASRAIYAVAELLVSVIIVRVDDINDIGNAKQIYCNGFALSF